MTTSTRKILVFIATRVTMPLLAPAPERPWSSRLDPAQVDYKDQP